MDYRDAGPMRIDSTVDPAGRAQIERAIASARPEARRLIHALTHVKVYTNAPLRPGTLGDTECFAGGHCEVYLDLDRVPPLWGEAGGESVVLHELGHVIDFDFVPRALKAELDAEIPAGITCPPTTVLPHCDWRAERFAETFAKWAMGPGKDIYGAYGVQPPAIGLDAWAAPIEALPLQSGGR